ncbi:MAG: hypothetical protein FWG15_02760 [Propionibacteriaceae bacterium]|nr:hypothetical protein [Propionibacteriaceae bacterium]
MTVVSAKQQTIVDVLYGARKVSWRWEILDHDPATGIDHHIGDLCGVEKGDLNGSWYSPSVKGTGSLTVTEMVTAEPGMIRLQDLDLYNHRIRPVRTISSLNGLIQFDDQRGSYLIVTAPSDWSGLGRIRKIGLHDRTTRLRQSKVRHTYTCDQSLTVMQWVQQLGMEAGELITVDLGDTTKTANPLTFDVGTSRLSIINELLQTIEYHALQVSPNGNLVTVRNIPPGKRSLFYDSLPGIRRELIDGALAIYEETWTHELDDLSTPNVVIGVAAPTRDESEESTDEPPLVAVAENLNKNSPYSIPRRGGQEIVDTLENEELPAGTTEYQLQVLYQRCVNSLVAKSSPVAAVTIKTLPMPIREGDVCWFRSKNADIEGLYLVTAVAEDCSPLGLMTLTLQEIINPDALIGDEEQ